MPCSLLNLSTELLIHIFAYLPVTDMFSVQTTCRRVYDIIAETAYLQYILHSHLNGVDDLFPLNCPFSERLGLLKHHEKTWNDLQFNLYSEFSANVNVYSRKTIIQDGYLIYKSNMDLTRYGYIDLCTLPPPNEEPRWDHISLKNFLYPYALEFFIDHDLVVAVRLGCLPLILPITLMTSCRGKGSFNGGFLPQLAFFEFTTGAPHPLSATHTVDIPFVDDWSVRVEVEVIGDHILAKAGHRHGSCSFHLISWKTGTVTFVSDLIESFLSQSRLVLIYHSFVNCQDCRVSRLSIATCLC